MIRSRRNDFLESYHHRQTWSLPDSIVYHMTKYPSSSKGYEKVIQTCKYFFTQNPFLVVSKLSLDNRNFGWSAWFNERILLKKELKNLLNTVWLTDELYINNDAQPIQNYLSLYIPKLYSNNFKKLTLQRLNIFFNDFMLLASNCEKIYLNMTTLMYKNGVTVAVEKIIESLPNVKDFSYNLDKTAPGVITKGTVKELLIIPHFLNLDKFFLAGIPEAFDIVCFYDYVRKNKKTKIGLHFTYRVSHEYRSCLQAILDEIVQAENHDYKVPHIFFSYMDRDSYSKLYHLYFKD